MTEQFLLSSSEFEKSCSSLIDYCLDKILNLIKHIHNLIQNHFADTEYGDWFHALDENFKILKDFK